MTGRSRWISGFAILVLGLTGGPGCATAMVAQAPPDRELPAGRTAARDGLPPQDLAAGECGAFFWDRAAPNRFRLFENESRGVMRYWNGLDVETAEIEARDVAYAVGQSIRRTYTFSSGSQMVVEGQITGQRGGESIIGRALLRRSLEGGAEEITPLVGLVGCRPAQTDIVR